MGYFLTMPNAQALYGEQLVRHDFISSSNKVLIFSYRLFFVDKGVVIKLP
ncbi:hypothetical protein [Fischerella thermalis]|nr:hypothetical protein [Fischerella thermalis]